MIRRLGAGMLALMLVLSCLPAMASNYNERQYLLSNISVLDERDLPDTPPGIHHFLLVTMDSWQNNLEAPGYNDGMVLVTVDELAGRIILTSFIRDMLVIRPDGDPGRLNRIIRNHGSEALMDTINRHFGIRIEKYILMDWRHIMEIVDAVGGVSVPLTGDEISYLKGWAVPENSTEPRLDKAGEYHLNGFASVIYMRIRKRRSINEVDTQDFGRTQRARMVLSSMGKQLQSISFDQAQELLNRMMDIWEEPYDINFSYPGIRNNGMFTSGVQPKDKSKKRSATNLSLMDLLDITRIAFALRHSEVEQFRLVDGSVRGFTYANSAGQLVDFVQNRQALHDLLFPESFMVIDDERP